MARPPLRAKTGCLRCKKRKKKCDETKPICNGCRRWNLPCEWEAAKSNRKSQAGPKPCTSPWSGAPGDVQSRALTDEALPTHDVQPPLRGSRVVWSPSTDMLLTSSSWSSNILSLPVCDALLDLYFDIVHNKQQILFHRQSFYAERQAGLVPDYIQLGIIALVARFSTHSFFRHVKPYERASNYLPYAIQCFNARSEPASIHRLQGYILLSFVCFVEGQPALSAQLAAHATRTVQVLGLPKQVVCNSVSEEKETRLYWQALMMDTWNSVRDSTPRQLSIEKSMSRYFQEETNEDTSPMIVVKDQDTSFERCLSNIWSQVVELTESFAEVVQILTSLVRSPQLASQAEMRTEKLALRLDKWVQTLPIYLQNRPANLNRFAKTGRLQEFVVPHLIYHHQSQLLYFPYLSKRLSAPRGSVKKQDEEFVRRCKMHAEALSELMWTTKSKTVMGCLWSPVNGHLLVVASTIHIHSLLFDPGVERASKVKKLLEQNFVLLQYFRNYWPSMEHSLSRLRTFHRFCELGYGQQSFRMDAWMLDFLNRYDVAIGERAQPY